jgi:hypothetical protein
MVAGLEYLEHWRFTTRGIGSDHTRQQVKGRFINAYDQPPLTARFFSVPATR